MCRPETGSTRTRTIDAQTFPSLGQRHKSFLETPPVAALDNQRGSLQSPFQDYHYELTIESMT